MINTNKLSHEELVKYYRSIGMSPKAANRLANQKSGKSTAKVKASNVSNDIASEGLGYGKAANGASEDQLTISMFHVSLPKLEKVQTAMPVKFIKSVGTRPRRKSQSPKIIPNGKRDKKWM